MASLGTTFMFGIRMVDQGFTTTARKATLGIRGVDQAAAAQRRQLQMAAASARQYAAQTMMAGMVAGGLAIIMLRSAKAAATFQEKMSAVSLVAQASSRHMGILRSRVMAMAGATEFKPSEIAESMRLLTQAGFTAAETASVIKTVADVATASFGSLDMQKAAGLTINIMRGFGLTANEAGEAMSKLTRITQLSPLALEDASVFFGFATAASAAFGRSLEETAVAGALLMPITRTASKAGTAWRAFWRSLVRPEGRKMLERLKVDALNADGSFKRFEEIIFDVEAALAKLPPKQREFTKSQLFGIRGMQLYAATLKAGVKGSGAYEGITLRGADAVRELKEQAAAATRTVKTFAEVQRQTAAKQLQRLEASAEKAKVAIGEVMLGPIGTLAESARVFTDGIESLTRVWDGWIAKLLFGVTAITAATLAYRGLMSACRMGSQFWQAIMPGAAGPTLAQRAAGQAPFLFGGGMFPEKGFFGPAKMTHKIGKWGSNLGGAVPLTRAERWQRLKNRPFEPIKRGYIRAFNTGIGQATKGLGNLLGPLGVFQVMILSLTFAFGKIRDVTEELYDSERKRLKRSDDVIERIGSLDMLLTAMGQEKTIAGAKRTGIWDVPFSADIREATNVFRLALPAAAEALKAGKPVSEALRIVLEPQLATLRAQYEHGKIGLRELLKREQKIRGVIFAKEENERIAQIKADAKKQNLQPIVQLSAQPGDVVRVMGVEVTRLQKSGEGSLAVLQELLQIAREYNAYGKRSQPRARVVPVGEISDPALRNTLLGAGINGVSYIPGS